MRIISRRTLKIFWEVHPDCEQQLKSWYQETEEAWWKSPNDIKADYPNASILAGNRIVFNIKGNRYRLIVKIIMNMAGSGSGSSAHMQNMIKWTPQKFKR